VVFEVLSQCLSKLRNLVTGVLVGFVDNRTGDHAGEVKLEQNGGFGFVRLSRNRLEKPSTNQASSSNRLASGHFVLNTFVLENNNEDGSIGSDFVVKNTDEVTGGDDKHALGLVVEGVGVGTDLADVLVLGDVGIVAGAVLGVAQGQEDVHRREIDLTSGSHLVEPVFAGLGVDRQTVLDIVNLVNPALTS